MCMDSTEEALGKVVAYLRNINPSLRGDRILQWFNDCAEQIAVEELVTEENKKKDAALRQIRDAAKTMRKALHDAAVAPGLIQGLYAPAGNPNLPMPLMDLARFESEIESLSRLGVQSQAVLRYYRVPTTPRKGGIEAVFALPPKKKTNDKLSVAVRLWHLYAHRMLLACGRKPVSGEKGNVARLGALLCAAAKVQLHGKASGAAARIVCSEEEALRYDALHLGPL